jgi:hypothetical protein
MIVEQDIAPAYLDTGTLGWVNVNHPHDVVRAEALLARVAATHPQPVQPPHPHS